MLLNLSNHPSTNWPANQLEAATQQFGGVQDMPFPEIVPEWGADEVLQLAERYYNDIRKSALLPSAVHLMGELTFTFALVQKLKAAGISCIASTTERIVNLDENGTKHSTFRFVRFRKY